MKNALGYFAVVSIILLCLWQAERIGEDRGYQRGYKDGAEDKEAALTRPGYGLCHEEDVQQLADQFRACKLEVRTWRAGALQPGDPDIAWAPVRRYDTGEIGGYYPYRLPHPRQGRH